MITMEGMGSEQRGRYALKNNERGQVVGQKSSIKEELGKDRKNGKNKTEAQKKRYWVSKKG